jgi:rare lipoprotein A
MQRITNHLAGALLVFLAGCATGPESSAGVVQALPAQEAAPAEPPVQIASRDTATPAPQPVTTRKVQRGRASWYSHRFQGHLTASGERYNRQALTAAHPTLPIQSYARVRNPANGREVVVRINDRGPSRRSGHVIDLSHAAAVMLGIVHGPRVVEIEQINRVERRGSHWPQERATAPAQPPLTVTAHADAAF